MIEPIKLEIEPGIRSPELEDLLPKLKEEACLAGGDGLIMQSSDTFSEGEMGTRVQRISATVIRWDGA